MCLSLKQWVLGTNRVTSSVRGRVSAVRNCRNIEKAVVVPGYSALYLFFLPASPLGRGSKLEMSDIFTSTNLKLSALAILYWDHILTLPEEIRYMWRRPISFGACLFFLNRYLSCVANVPRFLYMFSEGPSTQMCDDLVKFHQGLLIASQGIVAVILGSRVYAIWGCDKRILITICTLFASGAAVASWSMIAASPDTDDTSLRSCPEPGLSKQVAARLAIDWEYMFVFDAVVFVLTLVKGYRGMISDRMRSSIQLPLMTTMMKDGTLYFLAITLANAANVGTFYLSEPRLRGTLSTFSSSISVTLASRIMLNLHENHARLAMPSIDISVLRSNIQFQTVTVDDDRGI
ncbi:hypothetical protein DL96DRAFT_555770 [Flagelloscypha sp. PMI_526]|nr:hypothetical protein DL96DRAFT_555770 [Flagelloscypha sp. PMI_526]